MYLCRLYVGRYVKISRLADCNCSNKCFKGILMYTRCFLIHFFIQSIVCFSILMLAYYWRTLYIKCTHPFLNVETLAGVICHIALSFTPESIIQNRTRLQIRSSGTSHFQFLQRQYCHFSVLQVAGDSCGPGQSLPGQRKLPWAVLLHREAPEVLSDWSYPGGETSTKGREILTQLNITMNIWLNTACICNVSVFQRRLIALINAQLQFICRY